MDQSSLKSVDFLEFSFSKNSSVSIFDIIAIDVVNNDAYCLALLNKFLEIPYAKIKDLVSHHMHLVQNQMHWLDQTDKLLLANKNRFRKKQERLTFNKIQLCIKNEKFKKLSKTRADPKLINAEAHERYFSFAETKKHIAKLDSDCQKILHLTNEKYEYLQAHLYLVNPNLEAYDQLCQKRIDQIEHLQSLNEKLGISAKQHTKKLKFNGNVNQLVDIYFQLSRELFVDGKPFIDANLNDIAKVIIDTFEDKDGNPLSLKTVRTILTPSREDKRPNVNKRIDIDKLL